MGQTPDIRGDMHMNSRRVKLLIPLALLTLASCALAPIHDAALEDARTYVYGVRSDPSVIAYASPEIDEAVATLRRADDVAARGGTLTEVHDLAALARERAALAQQTARLKSADVAAQLERRRLEVAARNREADSAQRTARDAQVQADSSRQQAATAQMQATTAQRQADSAQAQAAMTQQQALAAEGGLGTWRDQLVDLAPRMMDRGLVVTLNDIAFERGATRLQPTGERAVSRLAQYLNANRELVVSVEGFTDDAGDANRNQQLSEGRALAVQSALAAAGVDPRRVLVRGYGAAFPIASNETSLGRQTNARVEIIMSDRGYVTPRV
jgi:outer membrane protein OmpA-like peptidoglycan-associated protein